MFNGNGKQNTKSQCDGPLYEPLEADEDLLTEDIVRSVKKTPVGQLLQKISTMPEVRQDKVLRVRREISGGKYNLNDRLSVALDNVLEELLT